MCGSRWYPIFAAGTITADCDLECWAGLLEDSGIEDIDVLRGAEVLGGSDASTGSNGREKSGSGGRSFCRTSTLLDLCLKNVVDGTASGDDMLNMLQKK